MAHLIKICMGSSCFARGNAKNLQLIQSFLDQNNIKAEIELVGMRCCNRCAVGPNITIDDKEYHHVDNEMLLDILEKILLTSERKNV